MTGEPKAVLWEWFELEGGVRVRAIGIATDGGIVCEYRNGTAGIRSAGMLLSARPLPKCTGWGWVEEVIKPVPQEMGSRAGADQWTGLKLWTYRTLSRGDRYVFIAADKGTNDWVEVVFDPATGTVSIKE